MRNGLNWAFFGTVTALSIIAPAHAGMLPPAGVPGPAIGLGLPALALLGYGYKRLRDRRKG